MVLSFILVILSHVFMLQLVFVLMVLCYSWSLYSWFYVTNMWFYLIVLCFRPVILAYNIPGVRDLVLSREQVVGIYNGIIRYWNDSSIQVREFLKVLITIFVSR